MQQEIMSDRNNRIQIRNMYYLSFMTMVVSLFIGVLGSIVDGIIIGRLLGPMAMASYGLISPVTGILMMLGSIVVSGASYMCVQYMSKGDVKGANGVFSLSIVTGMVVAVAFTAFILIFSGSLVRFLGADKGIELYDDARAYLVGLSFGFIFSIGSMVMHPYLNLEGDRKRTVAAIFVSLVVNISSDLICIYVIGGGLFGIAIATVLSQIAGFLISLFHFTRNRSLFRFSFESICFRQLKDLLSGGTPMAVNRLCYVFKVVLLNRLVLIIAGTTALSAMSVQNNLYNFISIASMSTAMSMMTNTGILEGEHNEGSMKILLKTGLKSGVIINFVISFIVFIFAKALATIYTGGDEEVTKYAVTCLRFFALSLVLLVVAQTYICFILGTGRKRLTVIYMLLHNLILPVGMAFFLGKLMGLTGFYASFIICEAVMLAIIFAVTFCLQKRIPGTFTDYMLLSDEFEIPTKNRLEWSMAEDEDAMRASEAAYEFLKALGTDNRKSMIASLSIEEMTRNIFEHGKKGNKKLLVYERLVVTKDRNVVLRIRDNGKQFDPIRWLELYEEKDCTKNIGIRMIFKASSDFRYVNTMGMNTLIIKI